MGENISKKTALLCLMATLGLTSSIVHADEQAQRAIDTRQGLLKVVGYYMGPMVGMARQQIPYDADMMKANAEKIAQLATMIPDVFRVDTSGSDLATEALDNIWSDTEDFNGKAATVAERASALAAATSDGQGAAMKAFGAMGGSCKSCLDDYRQQD